MKLWRFANISAFHSPTTKIFLTYTALFLNRLEKYRILQVSFSPINLRKCVTFEKRRKLYLFSLRYASRSQKYFNGSYQILDQCQQNVDATA